MFTLLAALSLAAPVPKPGPDWVTVKGTVVWPEKVEIPERKAFDATAIKGATGDYIRKGGAVYDDKFLVDEKTRGLKNVVVSIRPDDDDPKAKFPADRIHPDLAKAKAKTHTVTNEFCRFDRRVVVVRVGDSVKWVNKCPIAVAVSMGVFGEDSGTYTLLPGKDKDPVVTECQTVGRGMFQDVLCNWKDGTRWPADGRLWVFDHPYFAVTDENGEFEIKQVPKGKWRLMYHHESGWHKGKDGRLGFPVEVAGNKEGDLTLKPVAYEQPK